MKAAEPFLVALQFLTRLPVRTKSAPSERVLGYSGLYYPLVGAIIGVLLASFYWLLDDTSTPLRMALVLAAWIVFTGALHLDGLADSADAWIGGLGDKHRTLAIMKDPYCGPAAVATLTITILLKFAALCSLHEDTAAVAMLIVVPIMARGSALWLLAVTPYVRANGIGSATAANLPRAAALIAACGWLAGFAAGLAGVWMLLAVIAVFVLLRGMMLRRLGGMTGDTAGAMIEITETAALIAGALSR